MGGQVSAPEVAIVAESDTLQPTASIDSDTPAVIDFARRAVGAATGDRERAIRLYYAVRDEIRYDPFKVDTSPGGFRGGRCLELGYGYCIPKAALLAACGRAVGLPTRVGYGDVRNHLATPKLLAIMGSDLFVFHGYTEFFLEGRWVKATPAFNLALCEKFGVKPLEFDGKTDSLFHELDAGGRLHMEYIHDHGSFADVPMEMILASWRKHYPHAMEHGFDVPGSDFGAEAESERSRQSR